MRLLPLLLLPLAFALPAEEKRTGDNYGGGGGGHHGGGGPHGGGGGCSTARVTSVTTAWTTIPKPLQTTTVSIWADCYETFTKTLSKATTVPGTEIITRTSTPTTFTRLPPATTTKTYTATVTRQVEPERDHRRDAEPEPKLTNAQRLQRSLPLRAPASVAKKRTWGGGGHGWHPNPHPNPSCVPTTTTIWATISKTDRPCPTTTIKHWYCKPTTTTVVSYVPTTSVRTMTSTVPGTKTHTITKPPLTTTTVRTTVTTTVTGKPCKRDANGNIIEE